MKFASIDGISVTSMEDIHNILAQQLEFPAWYGGNLDALHDCLTDCTGKVRILHWDVAEENLGSYGIKAKRVIAAAALHNTALDLYI